MTKPSLGIVLLLALFANIIVGDLTGSIVAAEDITRSGVKMPLNFIGGSFVGALRTSGCKFGGKDRMILSAASLTLRRFID